MLLFESLSVWKMILKSPRMSASNRLLFHHESNEPGTSYNIYEHPGPILRRLAAEYRRLDRQLGWRSRWGWTGVEDPGSEIDVDDSEGVSVTTCPGEAD